MVLFNANTEEDPTNQNKEDNWIWITYYTDGSQITSIQIYDVLYGSVMECLHINSSPFDSFDSA